MVIFSGPHAYISPSWYVSAGPAVPTWNYAIVEELTERYESHRPQPWTTSRLAADAYDKMLNAIVGFEMRVERCETTFTLGQNGLDADRTGAAAGLHAEQRPASAEMAEFMRRHGGAGR